MLEIQMPHSAGELLREKCSTGYREVVEDACEVIEEGVTHNTLLMKKLSEFCPANELLCRIYLWQYNNAEYSISDKVLKRDAFRFSLFYEMENGERAYVHSDTDSEIFATPILEPLKISITDF